MISIAAGKVSVVFAVVLGVFLAAGNNQVARAKRTMADPLFGIFYNVDEVHFEDAPAEVGQTCKELRGRKMWMYAELKTPDAEYYIVSGFLTVRPDHPEVGAPKFEPDGGVAVELAGNTCRVAPADSFMWDDAGGGSKAPSITVTKPILEGLVTDALNRYTAAFGGKSSFLRALHSGQFSTKKLPPVLRARFEEFANRP